MALFVISFFSLTKLAIITLARDHFKKALLDLRSYIKRTSLMRKKIFSTDGNNQETGSYY